MMRPLAIWLIVALAPLGARAGSTVKVTETSLVIPTYAVGPADRNPAFQNPLDMRRAPSLPLYNAKVYPYPMQTDVTRRRTDKSYRAVVLENDLIRVIILPELGGRVYAAHDKTNGDVDFIYHNHVIKPALVALRGAWVSGGIEWNFPTYGHTVNTFSPVQYAIVTHDDGSATCHVGATEWVRRMRWSVAITLSPDRSYFRDRITLVNRTLEQHRAYYWTNAAVHAWDDTRVTFPPTNHTFAGRRRHPFPWPNRDGRDVSWYRNTPYAHDYFCGTPGDFHGAYNYDHDWGTVHTASQHDSPGAKFWTWGTADSGAIWKQLLTDNDGQYIEIQAGRLLTQGDTWIFDPQMTEQWDEYWYPIKQMGGFVKANKDIALNCELRGTVLHVAANATGELQDVAIRVMADDKPLHTQSVDLSPRQGWATDIPAPAGVHEFTISVTDPQGRQLIGYSTKPPQMPPPCLEPVIEGESANALYLRGMQALRHWKSDAATTLFEQAVEKDPKCTMALRERAILHFKAAQYDTACRQLTAVLAITEDDDKARYYRALCQIHTHHDTGVEADLRTLTRRAPYRFAASYLIAAQACHQSHFDAAATALRQCLQWNPNQRKAQVMLAAVLRHQRRIGAVRDQINAVRTDDPLCNLAVIETVLQQAAPPADMLTQLEHLPQVWLEAASDYAEMNLPADSLALLKRGVEYPDVAAHPLVHLYIARYAALVGDREQLRQSVHRALALPVDTTMPFRRETVDVLRTAAMAAPHNWKLEYYRGTLLAAKGREQEALHAFETAAQTHPRCAPLYANLSLLYARRVGDLDRAADALRRAVEILPDDYRYYLMLDQVFIAQGLHANRGKLFRSAPAVVRNNFRVALAEAQWRHDVGDDDRALSILLQRTFLPWEGQNSVRTLYVDVRHALAQQAISAGKYAQAIDHLKAVMKYPRNMGVGKPYNADFSRELYDIGRCYRHLGQLDRARRSWQAVVAAGKSPWCEKAQAELK